MPPTSRTASWMERTMMAVESYSVPSQSKAIKSKRRERAGTAWLGQSGGGNEFCQLGRQRRVQGDALGGGGVAEL